MNECARQKEGKFFPLHFLLQRGRPKEVKLNNRVNTDFSFFFLDYRTSLTLAVFGLVKNHLGNSMITDAV